MNLKDLIIKSQLSIKEALTIMNKGGEKILFVVDSSKRLQGVITDGDIRRGILKNIGLNENISKIINKKPISFVEGEDKEKIKQIMLKKKIEVVPVINKKNKVVDLVSWTDIFSERKIKYSRISNPVVIMAGGLGSRMAPFTKILPKALLPINDVPISELIIENFKDFGFNKFFMSINYKAEMIETYFKGIKKNYNLTFVKEMKPLGTVGALSLFKNKIKEDFFVSNCDILVKADYRSILKFHKKNKNILTIVSVMQETKLPYGVIEIEEGGVLKKIREKPEFHHLINTGFYVMNPEIMKYIPKNQRYDINYLIDELKKKGEKVMVYPINQESWFDTGQWKEYKETVNKMSDFLEQ